jgi:UDP-MurNAc hydroxylase
MQVTYLSSAAILVETDDAKLLCDPWLENGAFYGSWRRVKFSIDSTRRRRL